MQINTYLTFIGKCRQAMTFYKECLGGKLIFQSIGDSPSDVQMPENMKDCILHSALSDGNMVLLGSHIAPPSGAPTWKRYIPGAALQ